MSPAFCYAIGAVRELASQLEIGVPSTCALVREAEAAERRGDIAEAWRIAGMLVDIISSGSLI